MPASMCLKVLCTLCLFASLSAGKTIQSVRVNSVEQDSSLRTFGIGNTETPQVIAIEPMVSNTLDSSVPFPTIDHITEISYTSYWTPQKMSEELFNSLNTLSSCCKRDRLLTPFTFTFLNDSVTFDYEFLDGGCPFSTLEGTSTLVCRVLTSRIHMSFPWNPADQIIYANQSDSIFIVNNKASGTIDAGTKIDGAGLTLTNSKLRLDGSDRLRAEISFRDLHGKAVRRYDLAGSQSVSLADLDEGVYLCTVKIRDGKSKTVRFLKTR